MILKQTDILLILETLSIKIGEKFGRIDGVDFCNSSLPNFTYYHYLDGIIVSPDKKDDSYTSSYDQQSNIKSKINGNYRFKLENTQTFIRNNDEKI